MTRILPQMDGSNPFANSKLLMSSVQTFVLKTPELPNVEIPITTPLGLSTSVHEGLTLMHLLTDPTVVIFSN
jgi:hypothetical protein